MLLALCLIYLYNDLQYTNFVWIFYNSFVIRRDASYFEPSIKMHRFPNIMVLLSKMKGVIAFMVSVLIMFMFILWLNFLSTCT